MAVSDFAGKHRYRRYPRSEIRYPHHIVRNVYAREIDSTKIQLGVHHHRRGSSNQECRFITVSDYQDVRQSRKALDYWYTPPEQLARVVGSSQFHLTRCLLVQVSYIGRVYRHEADMVVRTLTPGSQTGMQPTQTPSSSNYIKS